MAKIHIGTARLQRRKRLAADNTFALNSAVRCGADISRRSRCAASMLAIAAVMAGDFCSAQTIPGGLPSVQKEVLPDRYGVNMLSGKAVSPPIGISIGSPPDTGLKYEVIQSDTNGNGVLNASYNYQIEQTNYWNYDTASYSCQYTVTLEAASKVFVYNCSTPSTLWPLHDDGSTLAPVGGGGFLFQGNDGSEVTFPFEPVWWDGSNFRYNFAASQIKSADGHIVNLLYDRILDTSGRMVARRMKSVTSNSGYQIRISYSSDSGIISNIGPWSKLTEAIAVNSGIDFCDPSLSLCSGLTVTWPKLLYTYQSNGLLLTDAAGVTMKLATGSYNGPLQSVAKGGALTPYVTYQNSTGQCVETVTSVASLDGALTYSCSSIPNSDPHAIDWAKTITRTNPLSQTMSVTGAYADRIVIGPRTITDELQRTTTYFYDANSRTQFIVSPEGTITSGVPSAGYRRFDYDSRGNLTQTTEVSKVGVSSLATSSGFDASCANRKTCNQPNWTKDGKAQQTDFTYAPAHGGVLTEMKPAAPIGTAGSLATVRPLRVTNWTQRNAWIKNASGQMAQVTDPIWLVSTVTECQTSASNPNTPACDASAPQILTTYEYGAAGTREALLVKGVAVSSGGTTLRTCYGYDVYARRISETKPNANLGTCP